MLLSVAEAYEHTANEEIWEINTWNLKEIIFDYNCKWTSLLRMNILSFPKLVNECNLLLKRGSTKRNTDSATPTKTK